MCGSNSLVGLPGAGSKPSKRVNLSRTEIFQRACLHSGVRQAGCFVFGARRRCLQPQACSRLSGHALRESIVGGGKWKEAELPLTRPSPLLISSLRRNASSPGSCR